MLALFDQKGRTRCANVFDSELLFAARRNLTTSNPPRSSHAAPAWFPKKRACYCAHERSAACDHNKHVYKLIFLTGPRLRFEEEGHWHAKSCQGPTQTASTLFSRHFTAFPLPFHCPSGLCVSDSLVLRLRLSESGFRSLDSLFLKWGHTEEKEQGRSWV